MGRCRAEEKVHCQRFEVYRSADERRLAFLCFMWDTQHAVLFCQSLCMSAFELRSNLPCDQSLWEANSAETWHQLRQNQPASPLFLSCLKMYLHPNAVKVPQNLNALSRSLLLHGLMSVAWDMQRRDQTSLGRHKHATLHSPAPLTIFSRHIRQPARKMANPPRSFVHSVAHRLLPFLHVLSL
jgi:hypothetical protein